MKYSSDALIRVTQRMIYNLDQIKLLCARGAYDDIIARAKRERGIDHTSYIEICTTVGDNVFGVSVDMDMKGHTMFEHYCVFTEDQFKVWNEILNETMFIQSTKNTDFFKILKDITIEVGMYPGSTTENGYYITLADFTSLVFIMSHDAMFENYLLNSRDDPLLVTVGRDEDGDYHIGSLIDLQLGKCSVSLTSDIVKGLELDEALLAIIEIPILNGTWELTKMYEDYTVSFKCVRMSEKYDFGYRVTICIKRGNKSCWIAGVPIYTLADLYLAMR